MTRLRLAILPLALAVVPLAAHGNGDEILARWMANPNGFGALERALTELEEVEADIQYNVYRDRAGYGARLYASPEDAELAALLEEALLLRDEIDALLVRLGPAGTAWVAARAEAR